MEIRLYGFGSPEHYNLWNNLSLATLKGDLDGYFWKKVHVELSSTNQVHDIDTILKSLRRGPYPRLIGISVQPGSLPLLKRFVGGLSQASGFDFKKTLIVFGNQLPTYFPEEFLKLCPEAVVVVGEGEISLRGLVEHQFGLKELADIPNLVYLENDKKIQTPIITPDLEKLDYPPDVGLYFDILKRGGNMTVQFSRGCPWGGCFYCTRTSFRRGGTVCAQGGTASWAAFSLERVFKELENIMIAAHTTGNKRIEIEIMDDDFIGGRSDQHIQRVVTIADFIETLGKKYDIADFTFRFFTEPSVIVRKNDGDKKNGAMRQLLKRLKQVGLVQIFIGVEGGTPEQLTWFRRNSSLEEIRACLAILKEERIGCSAGFIMFYPELTLPQLLANIRFFRENNLIQYNQWPFRPMVVNKGSRASVMLDTDNYLGKADVNYMAYEYVIKDPDIAWIAETVDTTSLMSRTIFYALKVKSKKYFDPKKQDRETILCQKYIEQNGLVFLDLMEKIGGAILASGMLDKERLTDTVVREAYAKLYGILARVSADIASGDIGDGDDFLKNEFVRLGIRERIDKSG